MATANPFTKPVNTFTAPPDWQAEQQDIARRMAMAQQLQEQGLQDATGLGNTKMAGSIAIPNSWTQGLAAALKTGLGGYQQGSLAREQKDLYKRQQDLTGQATSELMNSLMPRAATTGNPGAPTEEDNPMAGMPPTPAQPAYIPDQKAITNAMAAYLTKTGRSDLLPGVMLPLVQKQAEEAQLFPAGPAATPTQAPSPASQALSAVPAAGGLPGPTEAAAAMLEANPHGSSQQPSGRGGWNGTGIPESDARLIYKIGGPAALAKQMAEQLKPRPLHFQDLNDSVQALDPITGAKVGPSIPKSMSPAEAKRLEIEIWKLSNLTADQKANLQVRIQEAAQSGAARQNTANSEAFNTGMSPLRIPGVGMPSFGANAPVPSIGGSPQISIPGAAPTLTAPQGASATSATQNPRQPLGSAPSAGVIPVSQLYPGTPPGVTPKAQAELNAGQNSRAVGAKQILDSVGYDPEKKTDKISTLIQGSTSGMGQNLAANALGFLSHTTSGRENIGALTTLANNMTMQLMGGHLGSGISNADRDMVAGQLGDVANANKPIGERQAAWNAAIEYLTNLTKQSSSPSSVKPTVPNRRSTDIGPSGHPKDIEDIIRNAGKKNGRP